MWLLIYVSGKHFACVSVSLIVLFIIHFQVCLINTNSEYLDLCHYFLTHWQFVNIYISIQSYIKFFSSRKTTIRITANIKQILHIICHHGGLLTCCMVVGVIAWRSEDWAWPWSWDWGVVGSRAPLCVCCFWLPPFITICQSTLDAVTVAVQRLGQWSVPLDRKHYYVQEKEGVLTNPRAEGR